MKTVGNVCPSDLAAKRVSIWKKALIFTNFCYHNPGITARFSSACDLQILPSHSIMKLIYGTINHLIEWIYDFSNHYCNNWSFRHCPRWPVSDFDKCSFGRAVLFAHHHSLKDLSNASCSGSKHLFVVLICRRFGLTCVINLNKPYLRDCPNSLGL